jgi:hypothetical protein
MAVTRETFLVAFPEFRRTDLAIVDAKLAEAERMVSRSFWGRLADDGVSNYAAHLIAVSPLAEKSKFVERTGVTVYLQTFERLKRSLGVGARVI